MRSSQPAGLWLTSALVQMTEFDSTSTSLPTFTGWDLGSLSEASFRRERGGPARESLWCRGGSQRAIETQREAVEGKKGAGLAERQTESLVLSWEPDCG